jgi:hypothetical protein
MTVNTPQDKRVSNLSPHSVSAQSPDLSTDLESKSTQANGSFSVLNQSRVVMGWDDTVTGGPVLASCWSNPTTGHFKISVTLTQKGPTRGEMDAVPAHVTTTSSSKLALSTALLWKNQQQPRARQERTVSETFKTLAYKCRCRCGAVASGSVWNTCILSSEKGLAVAFQDDGAHVELIEDALTCVCLCVCSFENT